MAQAYPQSGYPPADYPPTGYPPTAYPPAPYQVAEVPAKIGEYADELKGREALVVGKRKWRDVFWIIPWVAQVAVVMYFGISFGIQEWNKSTIQTQDFWIPLAGAVVWGVLWATIWFMFLGCCPYPLMFIAVWMGPVMAAVAVGLAFWKGSYIIGGLLVLMFVLSVFWAIVLTKRIPFAVVLVQKALYLSRKFPAMYMGAIFIIFLYMIYLAAWTMGVSAGLGKQTVARKGPVTRKNSTGGLGNDRTYYWAILTAAMFSMFWTAAVAINVVTVMVAGTIATWYYSGEQGMPRNVTKRALSRALTTSFGSICLGSLLTALIRTLRWIVQQLRSQADGELAAVLFCIADCLIGFLDSLVEFFNKYAYIQVAIYGKNFTRAAKDTWDLFKAVGIQALIQYDLTGSVLGLGALVGGLIAGIGCALYVNFRNHGNNYLKSQSWSRRSAELGVLGVPVASLIVMVLFEVLLSIVSTLFVCYAEDPQIMNRHDPEFYQAIQRVQH